MSDVSTLQKELQKQQAKLRDLERAHAAAIAKRFKALPGDVGLASVDQLIVALAAHASPRMKGRLKGVLAAPAAVATTQARRAGRKAKRTRAVVTDAMRAAMIAKLKAGEKTGAQIAAEFGVSIATVNKIKADAKLTQLRGKK